MTATDADKPGLLCAGHRVSTLGLVAKKRDREPVAGVLRFYEPRLEERVGVSAKPTQYRRRVVGLFGNWPGRVGRLLVLLIGGTSMLNRFGYGSRLDV